MNVTPLPPQHRNAVEQVARALRAHRSFLIVGHIRPDGDCVGSQIGLGLALRAMGKEVRIYSPGPISRQIGGVPHLDLLETALDLSYQPECTVITDCGGIDRPGKDFVPVGHVVNIDHHVSNNHFGDDIYVNTEATATGEMIYDVLVELGAEITPDIASLLYLAIMADCGSFKFGNTVQRTFEVCTELVRRGADPSGVASAFYDNLTRGTLWLKGRVLENLHFECDGRVCWSEITQEMYHEAGGEESEPEGLVSEIRAIEGVEVATIIHEVAGGGARAGIRSRGTWDVNVIATELGGGGHRNASGCFIRGDYEEVRGRIVETIRRHVSRPPDA